jgi:hypothetical protein
LLIICPIFDIDVLSLFEVPCVASVDEVGWKLMDESAFDELTLEMEEMDMHLNSARSANRQRAVTFCHFGAFLTVTMGQFTSGPALTTRAFCAVVASWTRSKARSS